MEQTNHKRGGREHWRTSRTVCYRLVTPLSPPLFFFPFSPYFQRKFGPLNVQTSVFEKKIMGMACTFSGEESAKRRCSDVASGPETRLGIGGQLWEGNDALQYYRNLSTSNVVFCMCVYSIRRPLLSTCSWKDATFTKGYFSWYRAPCKRKSVWGVPKSHTQPPNQKKLRKHEKKTKKTKNTVRKLNKKQNNLPKNIKSRLFRKWGASPRLPKNCSCVYFCLFSRVVVWWFPCCLFHGSCWTLLCSVSLWLLFVLPKGFHWKNTLLKTPLSWSAPHWIAAWFRATLVEFVRPSRSCIRKGLRTGTSNWRMPMAQRLRGSGPGQDAKCKPQCPAWRICFEVLLDHRGYAKLCDLGIASSQGLNFRHTPAHACDLIVGESHNINMDCPIIMISQVPGVSV